MALDFENIPCRMLKVSSCLKSTTFWIATPLSFVEVFWRSTDTSVDVYQAIWHNMPEDNTLYSHCRENLKSYLSYLIIRLSDALKIIDVIIKTRNE
jgi:hypothetical protein